MYLQKLKENKENIMLKKVKNKQHSRLKMACAVTSDTEGNFGHFYYFVILFFSAALKLFSGSGSI